MIAIATMSRSIKITGSSHHAGSAIFVHSGRSQDIA